MNWITAVLWRTFNTSSLKVSFSCYHGTHFFYCIRNKSTVYSCFLDMSKAFERVNHSLLLKKLQSSNVNPCIINLLENVFRNSTASVFYNNCFSKKWTIRRGCRQGVLSAFLFSVYIYSILTEIGNFSFGCMLGFNKINIIAYADDIVLCLHSARGLQTLLESINFSLSEHELIVNADETAVMVFSTGKYSNLLKFYLADTVLNIVEDYKYLGVNLKSNLNEGSDMERCVNSFDKSFGFLFRKFNEVDVTTFYQLFLSYCTSFYGAEIWYERDRFKKDFKKISVSYHAALRNKYISNHFVWYISNCFTFEHFISYKLLKYMRWIVKCRSPVLFILSTTF